uniref:Uncharacterized protein n=1 Tax=Onchocerca volvulus TaxID=6282 RepID=A0A8R1XK05_ONCVO
MPTICGEDAEWRKMRIVMGILLGVVGKPEIINVFIFISLLKSSRSVKSMKTKIEHGALRCVA